jgi:uncharacterized membrane protein
VSRLVLFAIQYPSVIGTVVFFFIAVVRWFMVPADRKRAEWLLAATCLAIPAPALCEAATTYLSRLVPFKLDQYVFRIDGLLGFQPSFVLGRLAEHHLWLEIAGQVAYGALPCAVLAVCAAYLWAGSQRETLGVICAFLLNLFLAIPIYLLIPVCGPVFAFPRFPFVEPHSLSPHRIAILEPPNGIPSVHTSTALLILWLVWRWPLGRILGTIYLALIIFSTLASGQHYLLDLVIALPYALGILVISRRLPLTNANTCQLHADTEPVAIEGA